MCWLKNNSENRRKLQFLRSNSGKNTENMMPEIKFLADHKRYFTNLYLEDPTKLADYVNSDWITQHVKNLSNRLILRDVKNEECKEGGPYTGVGGIGYALLRVIRIPTAPKDYYINMCNQLLNDQLAHVSIKNISKSRSARYLTGTIGLYTIQALALNASGAPFDTIIKYYQSLLPTVLTPGYQKIGDDEILNGRAGFLTGVLLLRMMTNKEIISNDDIRRVLEVMISAGRLYSQENRSEARLMYQWHGSEYLGAAHGVSGIYQNFLSFWNLLRESEKEDVQQSIDWFLTLQSSEGNFPSSSEDRGDSELVHWCHGATGVITMLITAFIVTQNNKYLESAKRCTNVIWKKGILCKGPGICHGVAGSGYAFLLMYRLTSKFEYLEKAKVFAAILMDPKFEKTAHVPDGPFSLFEGWAGALCFLVDLLEPMSAQFPMIPIVFKDSFRKCEQCPASASCNCAE